MAMPGECIGTGAPRTCPDCGTKFIKPSILLSAAGYYLGYMCNCGPYSRESGYYRTREDAKKDLDSGNYNR